jgi:hypothetical protein
MQQEKMLLQLFLPPRELRRVNELQTYDTCVSTNCMNLVSTTHRHVISFV